MSQSATKLTPAARRALASVCALPAAAAGNPFAPEDVCPDRTASGNAGRQAIRRLARKGLLHQVTARNIFGGVGRYVLTERGIETARALGLLDV